MEEVARGYLGDPNAKPIFESSPFDVLGQGYQRPFELATLRLINMARILPAWPQLAPPNAQLLVQQARPPLFAFVVAWGVKGGRRPAAAAAAAAAALVASFTRSELAPSLPPPPLSPHAGRRARV